MSAQRLDLVCRATGERMSIEDLRRRGYLIGIVRVPTVRFYAVAHRAGSEPPSFPLDIPEGLDAAEFFDRINGEVIASCKPEVSSS